VDAGGAALRGDLIERPAVQDRLLGDVQGDDHLHPGDERVAGDHPSLLRREGEGPQGAFAFEVGLDFFEQNLLAEGGVVGLLLQGVLDPAEPRVGEYEVVKDQLRVHGGDVPAGVRRPVDMVDRVVLESAHHMADRVGLRDPLEDRPLGQILPVERRQKLDLDPRPRNLFRTVKGDEAVEARVADLDDADDRLVKRQLRG